MADFDDSSSFESFSDEEAEMGDEMRALGLELEGGRLKNRTTINNIEGLNHNLAEFSKTDKFPWIESLAVCAYEPNISNLEDDFEREMAFYEQALIAVKTAHQKLDQAGIPHRRPDDYFAEMIKTDVHMAKVREQLIKKDRYIAAAQERRKIREMKKFGKAVQLNKQREKDAKRKSDTETISKIRKNRKNMDEVGSKFDLDMGGSIGGGRGGSGSSTGPRSQGVPNKKRQRKNELYGKGGRKSKKDNVDDGMSFNRHLNKQLPKGVDKMTRGGKPLKRLGKGRRQNARGRN